MLINPRTFVDLAHDRGFQPASVVLAGIEAKENTALLRGQAESGQEVDIAGSEKGGPDFLGHCDHLPRLPHGQKVNYCQRKANVYAAWTHEDAPRH